MHHANTKKVNHIKMHMMLNNRTRKLEGYILVCEEEVKVVASMCVPETHLLALSSAQLP